MKKILIIEDNPDVRENTAEILELAGYEVVTAPDGKRGIEAARQQHPDLIICDIMMPELDGYGVLHVLGKHPDTASIPFIFLTAKAEKDDFRKGMNLGADDYLTKPFDDLALLDVVEIRLKKNEILKKDIPKGGQALDTFLQEARGLEDLNKLLTEDRKVIAVKKKHLIFREGNYANSVYFISKGKIKTFKTNSEGREFITGLHGEGDFIGYIELLENASYADSAEALEDSELVMIQRPDFFNLLHRNRDVAQKFIKLLANNVIDREERLLKLAYNSVRKRVAEALLMLYDRYQPADAVLQVSREDLSSLAGASKETVIRTLSDFKDEKLIEISGKDIRLLKLDKLRNMRN